jgi:ABC-type Na+ transport system ATPase subunit NatA
MTTRSIKAQIRKLRNEYESATEATHTKEQMHALCDQMCRLTWLLPVGAFAEDRATSAAFSD